MVWFDEIYATMLGNMEPGYEIPGIADAFAPGTLCEQKYSELCDMLEAVCDPDTPEGDQAMTDILNTMDAIQKDLCYRMFLLGMKFSRNS